MGAKVWVGWIIFFGLPILVVILVWLLSFWKKPRRKGAQRFFIIFGDSKNRLSLSRLQMLLWLVLLSSSFLAAAATHTKISVPAEEEVRRAKAEAQAGRKKVYEAQKTHEMAVEGAKRAAEAKTAAEREASDAEAIAEVMNAQSEMTSEAKAAAQAESVRKKADAQFKGALKLRADQVEEQTRQAVADARSNAKILAAKTRHNVWPDLPRNLLAIFGISVGTYVISLLLSLLGDKGKSLPLLSGVLEKKDRQSYLKEAADSVLKKRTEEATAASTKAAEDQEKQAAAKLKADAAPAGTAEKAALLADSYAATEVARRSKLDETRAVSAKSDAEEAVKDIERQAAENAGESCLIIAGNNLKKGGLVEIGGKVVNIIEWNDEGTKIVVDLPTDTGSAKSLMVDTANGRLCRALTLEPNVSLGNELFCYEFWDLLKDDINPELPDLMKIQLLLYTLIALITFGAILLTNLNNSVESLPSVPSSFIIFAVIISASYLFSKAITKLRCHL